jgi:subtilase family serine protease
MGSTRKALLIVSAVLLMLSAAWAQPQARITRSIDSRNMTRLQGVQRMARPEFDQGALDPAQEIQHVRIVFNRSAAQQAALEQLLADQQNPASPRYHQWLTPEQFAAQFGMSDADIAKVKDWLTSQGFTIDGVARGRTSISFSGPTGQINSAFNTELHQYAVNGKIHFANATPISIPTALAGVIAGVRALNDFKPKPHARSRRVKPDFTSSISGRTFLAPDDFATIYNLKALYAAGLDGTGQKIAVVGQTDLYSTTTDKAADITTFRSVSNLPANPPQIILVPGPDPGVVSGDVNEASLDIEWAGAVARKATIVYVNSGNADGVFDSLYYAIDNNVAPVISISYGLCEADETSFFAADEAELARAATQGQTVVGPSGDSGAADCDFSSDPNVPVTSATRGLAVDYPASSAYVTGVGGTTFNEAPGVTYWSSTNNVNQGSALFYIPEVAWNDTDATVGLAATGGGVSTQFTKPTWQVGTGVPNDGSRDVPDISFAASPGHDGFITCVQGDCQICVTTDANCPTATSPGYRKASDQSFDIAGGTSAGVPTFAGVVALLNQKAGSPQGLINPDLYVLAASSAGSYIFHDVTSGNNVVPCTAGSKDCPGSGSFGYTAGTGYDQVTGLGSVDAYNFITNWSTTPAADFSVNFFNPTLTMAKGSSSNILVVLQRQNGFSGTVSLSCSSALTGVTCSVSPGTVNPDGTATVTITASASAALHPPAAPFMPWWTSAFGVAAFFGMGQKRSKKQMLLLALLIAAIVIGMASCGGGGNNTNTSGSTGGSGNTGGTGTTGTVTLTATSGSLTHSTTLNVTVN